MEPLLTGAVTALTRQRHRPRADGTSRTAGRRDYAHRPGAIASAVLAWWTAATPLGRLVLCLAWPARQGQSGEGPGQGQAGRGRDGGREPGAERGGRGVAAGRGEHRGQDRDAECAAQLAHNAEAYESEAAAADADLVITAARADGSRLRRPYRRHRRQRQGEHLGCGAWSRDEILHCYGACCRPFAVEALCRAWQVTLADPQWARNDHLWAVLRTLAAGRPQSLPSARRPLARV